MDRMLVTEAALPFVPALERDAFVAYLVDALPVVQLALHWNLKKKHKRQKYGCKHIFSLNLAGIWNADNERKCSTESAIAKRRRRITGKQNARPLLIKCKASGNELERDDLAVGF
jgi:hypothetical protein